MAIQIAVCGPRHRTDQDARNAREVGRLLALAGAIVVCGGYNGVMSDVAASARAAGGMVVGILSGKDRTGATPDLTVAVATGVGEGRNNIIVQSADAVIVIGGSWGTLSELALAMRNGTMPVITLGGWRILDHDGRPLPGPIPADSPSHAVEMALERAAQQD